MKVPCLVLHPGWAWLVANGWKTVENRSWLTNHRGPLLISAGSRCSRAHYDEVRAAVKSARENGAKVPDLPPPAELERGAIVGAVVLSDITDGFTMNPWAEPGHYHWHFERAITLPRRRIRGQQCLFGVELTASEELALRSLIAA